MRFVVLILGVLALAQCATADDGLPSPGAQPSRRGYVVIGVAEASENREARYSLLWRQLDSDGAFAPLNEHTSFEAETNQNNTLRVRGIPGEFDVINVEPGVYALDSVYALIRDDGVNYVADGVITGPERPVFEVRAGESVYLGIWQVNLDNARAVTRLWRLDEADLRAIIARSGEVPGPVHIRQTQLRSVTCAPHPMNSRTRRQVC